MQLSGSIIKYGDNIDTDVIIPARYLHTADPAELARHCMEDLDPRFHEKLGPGSILVAGENFGCGSSREHAPIALAASGVSLVVAASFARIFFRNALNIALPILECPQAVADAAEGDTFTADFDRGILHNESRGLQYEVPPFPPFLQQIIRAGGLMKMAQAQRGEGSV
ncbi:MAG: 3-isopropylmalate dehydratase small subunit [Eubacteriales bacterium]